MCIVILLHQIYLSYNKLSSHVVVGTFTQEKNLQTEHPVHFSYQVTVIFMLSSMPTELKVSLNKPEKQFSGDPFHEGRLK